MSQQVTALPDSPIITKISVVVLATLNQQIAVKLSHNIMKRPAIANAMFLKVIALRINQIITKKLVTAIVT
jgi:hypothetical protein